MNSITVYLHNGELKHESDGHFYNSHVITYDTNESINPSSNMVELDVYCIMCEKAYSKRIHTDENWRIDILYTYLVGQFDESCPAPRNEIAAAAKDAWKQYKGQPLTNDVRMDMMSQIRDVCDEHIQVNFV